MKFRHCFINLRFQTHSSYNYPSKLPHFFFEYQPSVPAPAAITVTLTTLFWYACKTTPSIIPGDTPNKSEIIKSRSGPGNFHRTVQETSQQTRAGNQSLVTPHQSLSFSAAVERGRLGVRRAAFVFLSLVCFSLGIKQQQ